MGQFDLHPMEARHLVQRGYFGTLSAASRWMAKRYDRGELAFYCRHRLKARGPLGKPGYYYHSADVRFKRDNARHEVALTEVLSLYWKHATSIRRGPDADAALLPDAEMVLGGVRYLVELDTGKMTTKQVRARWKTYAAAQFDDTLLVVTLGRRRRLETLLRISGDVADAACFTTLDLLLKDPFGRVWVDTQGGRYRIEIPGA